MNRIDRLTATLIHLQTKRVVKAEEIADRFEISLRTVYRDVRALMEAGVPIGSEAGKGYFIVDGYHLPPVMFSQDEASAMLLAGKLVDKMTDKSVRSAYDSAMLKIRAVLNESEKDHLEKLDDHIEVHIRQWRTPDLPDHFITQIQGAVSKKEVLALDYLSNKDEVTRRDVEPIGLFYYGGAWHLIAWCRLRNGYRDFRSDRIRELKNTSMNFDGRNLLSLQEYLQSMMQSNKELIRVKVLIDKSVISARPVHGSVSETDLGDKVRFEFLMDRLVFIAHWLLMFGTKVEIEEPEELKELMSKLASDLYTHYASAPESVLK
jgi:predicted DNA-binding transcriptional regulator YafY